MWDFVERELGRVCGAARFTSWNTIEIGDHAIEIDDMQHAVDALRRFPRDHGRTPEGAREVATAIES